MEIFIILLIIGFIFWFYGRQILVWVLQHWINKKMNEQAQNFQQNARKKETSKPNNTSRTPSQKMNLKEITKKKFEKDQGEYVDFEEER